MLLDQLPPEMLLQIFDYISTQELFRNVRLTCSYFNSILLRSQYWVTRAQKFYGVHLPSRLKERDADRFEKARRSHAVERIVDKWSDAETFAAPITKTIHYATIDTICQFRCPSTHKVMCVSGARDRSIIFWDVEAVKRQEGKLEDNDGIADRVDTAHEGWIWQLCMKGNSSLYSAGWDGRLKEWHLTESGIKAGSQLHFGPAVLSCVNDGSDIIYTSTYNAGPIACDTRCGLEVVQTLSCHPSKPVFSMATGPDTNYIYSVGEDSRIVVVDKRKFTGPVLSHRCPLVSRVCYSSGYLAASFRNGLLKVLDPITTATETQCWIGPTDAEGFNDSFLPLKHMSMSLSTGGICASYGHEIKLLTLSLNPRVVAKYEADALITQLSCTEDLIVTGSGMGSLNFW